MGKGERLHPTVGHYTALGDETPHPHQHHMPLAGLRPYGVVVNPGSTGITFREGPILHGDGGCRSRCNDTHTLPVRYDTLLEGMWAMSTLWDKT